jgi:hypothetical protein
MKYTALRADFPSTTGPAISGITRNPIPQYYIMPGAKRFHAGATWLAGSPHIPVGRLYLLIYLMLVYIIKKND